MKGATRTVTVLFTDIVGSTDLMARVGTAAATELGSAHFDALRRALAVHRGAEVKTLGDGLMAVFESAADSLACAVTMQQLVASDPAQREQRVSDAGRRSAPAR